MEKKHVTTITVIAVLVILLAGGAIFYSLTGSDSGFLGFTRGERHLRISTCEQAGDKYGLDCQQSTCQDGDCGQNIEIKATTTAADGTTDTDVCMVGGTEVASCDVEATNGECVVKEYDCDGSDLLSCEEYGYCNDGRCASCDETDDGLDYETYGTVTDDSGNTYTDQCLFDNQEVESCDDHCEIREAFCNNGVASDVTIDCTMAGTGDFCYQGECVNELPN